TAEALRRHRTFHLPDRTAWVMPREHALDIDTEEDLRLVERLFPGPRAYDPAADAAPHDG
ncbi:MAG: hypothetical protein R3247_14355, partial [Rhodothermales bacterium]|nr:hypothetical protein [Rhodothermales bacterium]